MRASELNDRHLSFPERRGCPFCDILAQGERRLIAGNEHAAAFYDAYALNPGHALIVPRRHEANPFRLSAEEQAALWELLPAVRERVLADGHAADGWNVGLNVGVAGGQTIPHVHLHLIPRLEGDASYPGAPAGDPRGGVRWVVPARAAYWRQR